MNIDYLALESYTPQKSVTFTEQIDYDLLKVIVYNFDAFYQHLGGFKDKKDNYKEIKDKTAIHTLFKNRLKVKNNTFTYKITNNGKYGRVFPDGWSLCMMNKITRHTICKDYNYDIDIVNAHLVFLKWYCSAKKIKADYINDYCDKREETLARVCHYRNCSRDDAKTLILALLNDQNRVDITTEDPLYNYYQEVKTIQDFIAKENKNIFDVCRKSNPNNTNGSCIAKFLQTMENKVLHCMLDFCRDKNIRISAPCFDGFLAYKEDCDAYGFDNLLSDLEQHVRDVLTIPINLLEKKMEKGINHLLTNYEDNASTISSMSSDEGDYFDEILLSDERVGIYVLQRLIQEENVFYHKNLNQLYCYNEEKKLYIIKEKSYLMTYISRCAPMMMNELDLNNLKRFNKLSRKNIILRRNSFESTGGQSAILKQINNRLEDGSEFIDVTFDRIPYLLPIKDNKVVDMKNDVIRERTRNDYFTKYCNIDYDPEVDVEEVKVFLRQYLIKRDKTELDEDDNDHIDMVLGILGYSITGYNNLKKIFVALGVKDTGKSSIFNRKIFEAFSAFFCNADKKVICETKNKAVHTQELFPLIGNRFFSTGELDEEEKLNNGFLKSISGDDKLVSMRKCGGDKQFDGIIDCKLILPLNTMSKSADSALLKRLVVIEFPNVFREKDFFKLSKEQRDYIQEGVNSKLYSAVIKYAHYFIKNNFTIRWSKQSMIFTTDIVSKCDDVTEFMMDNYVFTNDINDRVTKGELYNHFCREYRKADLSGHKIKFYNRIKQLYPSEKNINICIGRDAFRCLKIRDKNEDDDIF